MTSALRHIATRLYRLTVVVSSVVSISACSSEAPPKVPDTQATSVTIADAAYIDGSIYTVDTGNTWAEAIAIAGGKIIAVGSNEEIAKHVDSTTEVSNLNQRMVMPGIHDMHVHPREAGEK